VEHEESRLLQIDDVHDERDVVVVVVLLLLMTLLLLDDEILHGSYETRPNDCCDRVKGDDERGAHDEQLRTKTCLRCALLLQVFTHKKMIY
jgi:hypothetical protein